MKMKRYAPLSVGLVGLVVLGMLVQPHFRLPLPLRNDGPVAVVQAKPKPPSRRFSMIAVGDIMTDRNVGEAIKANGARSILARVRDLTNDADVTFGNLECPLATVGAHAPQDCIFRARPETVQVLLDGGFDVVSLANNHTFNAGMGGMLQTLDTLEQNEIAYCGASRDKTKGGEARILEVGEAPMRVGFIAATDMSFGHGSQNKVSPDRANLVAQIEAAKPLCDVLCVSVHWGDEYQSLPNERQRETAHAAVDAGADLILGHHPHTLQGIEVYRGKPILYSMGNFVFDQREGERMESAIFKIDYTEGWGWQIMAKPIWIPRSRMGPIYPDEARRDKILARLAKISQALGTELQILNGKAWLRLTNKAAAVQKGSNIHEIVLMGHRGGAAHDDRMGSRAACGG